MDRGYITGMNIIITGDKRAGKTTAVNTALKKYRGTVSGFRTRFDGLRERDDRRLYLINLDNDDANLVVTWRENIPHVDTSAFDRHGSECIDRECELVLMDELGKFETEAENFRSSVISALEGPCDVIAVIRRDAEGWMEEIKHRDDVVLLTVTEENRDEIPARILNRLEKQR